MSFLLPLLIYCAAPASAGPAPEATRTLEEFVRSFPDDDVGLNRLLDHYDRLGRKDDAAAVLAAWVSKHPRDLRRAMDLSYRWAELKRWSKWEAALDEVVRRHPEHDKAWWELIHGLSDRKRTEKTVQVLSRYLQRNPKNLKARRALAEMLISAKRFKAASPHVHAVLKQFPNEKRLRWDMIWGLSAAGRGKAALQWLWNYRVRFPDDGKAAEEGAYLYGRLGQRGKAIAALENYLKRRPQDDKRSLLLTDLLLEAGNVDEAASLIHAGRKRRPRNPLWIVREARLYARRGDSAAAAKLFQALTEVAGKDGKLFREIGTQAYFAEDFATARSFLKRAHELTPMDAEPSYYLAETEFSAGRLGAGRAWARRALDQLKGRKGDAAERRRLRLESIFGWGENLNRRYRALIKRRPGDWKLFYEYLDPLLRHDRNIAAAKELGVFRERFPKRRREAGLIEYRLAYRRRDWPRAVRALRSTGADPAADAEVGLPLAEAFLNQELYREADAILCPMIRSAARVDCYARELDRQLHERHDHTVGPWLRFYEFPGDVSREAGLAYRGHITSTLRLKARAYSGTYRAGALSARPGAAVFDAELREDRWRPVSFGATGEATEGAPRDTVSPGAFLELGRSDTLRLRGAYRHRSFWNDFAAPVAAGGLEDETRAELSAGPWRRVSVSASYEHSEYRLRDAEHARRDHAAADVTLAVIEGGARCGKPNLSLGYGGYRERTSGDAGFFTQVPLVRRSFAHCANAAVDLWPLPGKLRAAVSGYGCADSERSLGFGELFGAGARVVFIPRPGLRARAAYEYGRESAVGSVGQSHTIGFSLEVHWNGWKIQDLSDRR